MVPTFFLYREWVKRRPTALSHSTMPVITVGEDPSLWPAQRRCEYACGPPPEDGFRGVRRDAKSEEGKPSKKGG